MLKASSLVKYHSRTSLNLYTLYFESVKHIHQGAMVTMKNSERNSTVIEDTMEDATILYMASVYFTSSCRSMRESRGRETNLNSL